MMMFGTRSPLIAALLVQVGAFQSDLQGSWTRTHAAFSHGRPIIRAIARPSSEPNSKRAFTTCLRESVAESTDQVDTNGDDEKDGKRIFLTNQDLNQRRLDAARAKREAREKQLQASFEKNMRMKELMESAKGTQDSELQDLSPLVAVKVYVDQDLRSELKLSGKQKRGRVFLERNSAAVTNINGLKSEIQSFFSSLKYASYILSAQLPHITEDGTILSPDQLEDTYANIEVSTQGANNAWPINNDEDVMKTFAAADDFFKETIISKEGNAPKRPSIQITVHKNPNAPPPPPPPEYLHDMKDPKESSEIAMLSFYSFPPTGIDDPEDFAMMLRSIWRPFAALGRIYVAFEGVNAQMSVPSNVLDNFIACCRSIPELTYMENGINIDPIALPRTEFYDGDDQKTPKATAPFKNLHVRVRQQIVADGLDPTETSLDWQSAGYDMPPLEWHEQLKRKANPDGADDEELPIVLDCRNTYETDVGIFEGAEPLGTDSFRESWDVLKERLAGTPKDAPIMTYCTGGIRCVKVGAYLTQELGFKNVSRLAGGIIAYDRTMSDQIKDERSMFKGTNFVFDGRLGRAITDDALGECISCGAETALVSNCRNDNCHQRMVQCERCRTAYLGACSDACKQRVVNGNMIPRRGSKASEEATKKKFNSIDEYSIGHSSPVPSIYKEMELNTRQFIPSGSHMVSGESQGQLLKQLASMTREGRILEIGTFSGYATVCFAEGARAVADITGQKGGDHQSGPYVMTVERDSRAIDLACAHFEALEAHGFGEDGAEKICSLRNETLSAVEGDLTSFKLGDEEVGLDVLRVTDALATLEAMSQKKHDPQPAPFDLIFLDADKTRFMQYVEACLCGDILKRGGLILVDNVLWKGLVLEASSGEFSSVSDDLAIGEKELKKSRRARKLATQMHRFNAEVVLDSRVDVTMLPVRDGLTLIRKL